MILFQSMVVKIRLARIGKKKNPKYRVVAMDKNKSRDSKYLEQLGFYDPMVEKDNLKIDEARLNDWVSKGAKLSESLAQLLSKRK